MTQPIIEEDGIVVIPPLVLETGMNTEVGKTQAAPPGVTKAKGEEVKTPLGIRLDDFGGDSMTKTIGVLICIGEYSKALGCLVFESMMGWSCLLCQSYCCIGSTEKVLTKHCFDQRAKLCIIKTSFLRVF